MKVNPSKRCVYGKDMVMNMWRRIPGGVMCLAIIGVLFGYIGSVMGVSAMLNTIMHTAHDLLLNTCFYLMSICVLTGALGKIFAEFGVVDLIEKLLRPLMRPIFHLPGVASLGAVLTFLSDNPAIITLAKDKKFSSYFKKYQYISLTNFGTAFGMGLIVIVFMIGQGYMSAAVIGLLGACAGCIVSTRLMQRLVLKSYPQYRDEDALSSQMFKDMPVRPLHREEKSLFLRILNALLDGGKSGVDVGMSIIPGVLIISTFVMVLTFGPGEHGTYTGQAYEGIELLPALADHLNGALHFLFGFSDAHQVAFPITALGAVGAALGLVPNFVRAGWIDGNAIAVFTAMGMCWSGFLSTHTAMLDSIGYRELTSKAILSHTIGGLCAGIAAHLFYLAFTCL